MATTETRLARIDAAIEAIEAGGVSSYSIGNRSASKLSLKDLYEERRRLENQLHREQGGSIRPAKMRRTSR